MYKTVIKVYNNKYIQILNRSNGYMMEHFNNKELLFPLVQELKWTNIGFGAWVLRMHEDRFQSHAILVFV